MINIENRINNIFSSISGYPEELLNKGVKIADTRIDSLMIIKIIVKIEEEFGIEIKDEYLSLSKIKSMEELYNVVNKTLEV